MMFWKRLGYLLPWRRRAAERTAYRRLSTMGRNGELNRHLEMTLLTHPHKISKIWDTLGNRTFRTQRNQI